MAYAYCFAPIGQWKSLYNLNGKMAIKVRKTTIEDAVRIQALINEAAKSQEVLPRSLNDIYENIRDFFVFAPEKEVLGCCALHVCWDNLAEVRSLVVHPSQRHNGVGTKLVKACISEAELLKIKKIFLLTLQPEFFKKFGFKNIEKSLLPHKIWHDCTCCVQFPDCNEIAMMKEI